MRTIRHVEGPPHSVGARDSRSLEPCAIARPLALALSFRCDLFLVRNRWEGLDRGSLQRLCGFGWLWQMTEKPPLAINDSTPHEGVKTLLGRDLPPFFGRCLHLFEKGIFTHKAPSFRSQEK